MSVGKDAYITLQKSDDRTFRKAITIDWFAKDVGIVKKRIMEIIYNARTKEKNSSVEEQRLERYQI